MLAGVFGLCAGWACNRLFTARLAVTPAGAPAPVPSPLPFALRWGTLSVLVLGSLGLGLHPALRGGYALSQGLLLFYTAYALAVVDLYTLTVEPALVLGGLALRLVALAAFQRDALPEMIGGALAGAGLLYLAGFAYQVLRGREGLGEGDPAVMALIGAFVGWQGLPGVLLLGAAAGVLVGFPALLLLRRPLDTPIPFVPFLCLGGMAVYLLGLHGILIAGTWPW